MDRDEILARTADVYAAWESRYINEPGFDAEFPTLEQETEYFAALKAAGVAVGGDDWQRTLAQMTPEEVDFIRAFQEDLGREPGPE